jgi:Rps23 Pro-64 3,4-dihydroxylase Tpa1-like proline 4-hydroxylase
VDVAGVDRASLAQEIARRLNDSATALRTQWNAAEPTRHCILDDLLPEDVARKIAGSFPDLSQLMLRSSMRERKRVGVQVDSYDPIIGDILYAFQEPVVCDAVRAITGHLSYAPDPSLYAAGISVMADGDYLSPHVDNSHDGDGKVYRSLNLLYYVSPDWDPSWGGNLELWDPKVRAATVAECRFNRLLLMETTPTSWHSVSKVHADRPRYCVSNYYFSDTSPVGHDYRHVTTFNGWPDEHLKRALLTVTDKVVFNAVGRLAPALTKRTKHRLPTAGK